MRTQPQWPVISTTSYRRRTWYEAAEQQLRPGVLIYPADRRGRSIVHRRRAWFHGAERSPSARTVIVNDVVHARVSRDAETSILDFTRTHFTILALSIHSCSSSGARSQDRTVLLQFLIPGKQSLRTLTESSLRS
jgi:hypothetical protein